MEGRRIGGFDGFERDGRAEGVEGWDGMGWDGREELGVMGVTEGLLGDFNGGGLGLEFWRWVLVLVGACVVVGRRVEGVWVWKWGVCRGLEDFV